MSRHEAQRKRLFVNRFLQGRVLAHVAWYWCIYHVCMWHALFLYHYLQHRGQILSGEQLMTGKDLYLDFARNHVGFLLCAALTLPFVLWDTLKMTHRVAGPLVRITATLKQLARGENIREIRLRRGDLLVGLQDALNEFLASPYAPPPRMDIHDKAIESAPNPAEVEAILEELREIQESLCREYLPENSRLSELTRVEAARTQPLPFDPHELPVAKQVHATDSTSA
jgi:hypothetical protein